MLLMDSLRGTEKTLKIICAGPCGAKYDETFRL